MFGVLSGIFIRGDGFITLKPEVNRIRMRLARGASMDTNKKCGWCGKEFFPTRSNVKYCKRYCKDQMYEHRKKETMTAKKELTRRSTKPDAPKALATSKKQDALTLIEKAANGVDHALSLLNEALSADPKIDTVVLVQTALKSWSKRVEDAEKISKSLLIEHLKEHGEKTTDKGSLSANVQGYLVEARPWRTGLDSKKVESLLRAKELSVDEFMDKEIKYIVNESRLALGVVQGTFTQDELDTCKYELSYALQPIKKVGGTNE